MQQPVDVLYASCKGARYGRQAIWDTIRALPEFTLVSLSARLSMSESTVKDYLRGLVKAGYVRVVEKRKQVAYSVAVYALVRDSGVEAPRINRKGEALPPTGQQRMWDAMKVMPQFTPVQIVAAASADTSAPAVTMYAALAYVSTLSKAGYLAQVGGAASGCAPEARVYRLLRNTGGAAPMVQKTRVVFDPNTGEVALPEWSDKEADKL